MKKILSFLFIVSITLILSSCQVKDTKTERDGLNIVTSIPPLYSLTSHLIEGGSYNLSNILAPGMSVHTFSMTPSISKRLEDADIIIINGLELEHFLEESLSDLNDKILVSSEGIELLEMEDHEDDDHEEEHTDEHGDFDPHVWLDPMNALKQAENIRSALISLDPSSKELINSNFEGLKNKLLSLHKDIKEGLLSLNIEAYIVFHNAYSYFEEAYDIHASASVEKFPGKKPSPKYLKDLIDLINEKNIKVIFTEPQFSPKMVDSLVSDYGLKTAELDPLGKNISHGSYFEMMRSNLDSFKSVFDKKD